MTDLTAAQLAERLYDPLHVAPTDMHRAADLIGQQAEQIAGLLDEAKEWPGLVDAQLRRARTAEQKATDHYQARVKAESEAAALRKVIEDAPHDEECGYWEGSSPEYFRPCTCWKLKALPDKETL